jgi:serine/threonine-protein kinase
MGQVYLAVRREGAFERLFALKRLKPELVDEPDVRAMFLDEARLAGLIRHPNVVGVVDVGQDGDGPFLVMEYVEGITASDLARSASEKLLPVEVCLRVVRDVAEGLQAAHELSDGDGRPLRLVHRDVSPQNILISFDGTSRVTDFGIAKALGRVAKTSTGVLKGKLGYMAPEQLRFEEPDRRADLFALGVVLFELLTGRRLYESNDGLDGPRRILAEPPPDLTDYREDAEPELVDLLFHLLAKNPAARPESAKEVARACESLLADLRAAGHAIETSAILHARFRETLVERHEQVRAARAQAAAALEASAIRALQTGAAPQTGATRNRVSTAIVITALAIVAIMVGASTIRPSNAVAPSSSATRPAPITWSAPVSSEAQPERPEQVAAPHGSAAKPGSLRAPSRPAAPRPATGTKRVASDPQPGVPMWETY